MSIEKNIQTAKDFFAAISRGDKESLLALVAEDIEWIIPGKDWPLAGTHRGHAGLADLLKTASKSIETSTEPREFVAQGDRVLVIGFAKGKVKATNGSSPSRSGAAGSRTSANTSIRKPWREPHRWHPGRRSAFDLRPSSAITGVSAVDRHSCVAH
jgi:ketosteroid isomerase-like protein